MSNRRAKRALIKELGVEKFSDRMKRKLKEKNESSRSLRSSEARKGRGKSS